MMAEPARFRPGQGQKMTSGDTVRGPTSYFPCIERICGQPIDHWMQVLKEAGPLKHMELVAHLKTQHQLGHGHANALVAWFNAKQ
jgi:hypothetical protein